MKEKLEAIDYLDDYCCINKRIKKIPINQILEKLDYYLDKKNGSAAKDLLLYWLNEARSIKDLGGEVSILNELMGFFRLNNIKDEALLYSDYALKLVDDPTFENPIQKATTYLNAGTVKKTFNMTKDSILLYQKAYDIYTLSLPKNDPKMAALLNNYALALVDNSEFTKALDFYTSAISILSTQNTSNALLEAAITYLNIASLYEKKEGPIDSASQIDNCLLKAWELLSSNRVTRNSYFAFVCSKCSSGFRYFGYFTNAKALEDWASDYYERT